MSKSINIVNTNTIKIFVKDRKKRKTNDKFPKSILVLFLSSQLLFGIDFGFSSIFKKKYQLIVKRFSFFMSVAMIVLNISPLLFDSTFYWIHVIEYTSFVLVLNFTKYNAFHFINDIRKICELNQNDKRFLRIVGVYYNVTEFLGKIIFVVVMHKIEYDTIFARKILSYHIIYTVIYHVPTISLDIISIAQIVLMYYLNCCVRHMKALLLANDVNFVYIESYFRDIANSFDKIKPLYGRIVSNIYVHFYFIFLIPVNYYLYNRTECRVTVMKQVLATVELLEKEFVRISAATLHISVLKGTS